MIDSLIGQYSGAQYGELVQEHYKRQKKDKILGAFKSINTDLRNKFQSIDLLPLLNIWHEASENKILFRGDCGKIFKQINDSFSEYIDGDYSISDDDFLSFFNLVTLNLAFNVHLDSQYKTHFFNSFQKEGFFSKIFIKKEEKVFLEFWEKDVHISEDFDSFQYSKIFPKEYFVWLYKDFGSRVPKIKTYYYKKLHLLGIANHYRGQNVFSTKKVIGNFIEITYKPNLYLGISAEKPFILDCQSLSMANKLMIDFITERFGNEGADWEIVGSAYLANDKIPYGTIRTVFGNHKGGQFKYYFDFSKPNSNPMNRI